MQSIGLAGLEQTCKPDWLLSSQTTKAGRSLEVRRLKRCRFTNRKDTLYSHRPLGRLTGTW